MAFKDAIEQVDLRLRDLEMKMEMRIGHVVGHVAVVFIGTLQAPRTTVA